MPLRLAIAAPRFWPFLGDDSNHLLQLAAECRTRGHETVVVTPQWKRAWPREQSVSGVHIVRLPSGPHGLWPTFRWMYHLRRWFCEPAQARLDAILACGLGYEAYVALGLATHTKARIALLAGEHDLHWQEHAALGSRIAARCRQADCIIAPTPQVAQGLVAAGYREAALHIIPRGAPLSRPRTLQARAASRATLAAANYDLATGDDTLVALAIGRFDEHHRFGDLVRAWRIVRAKCPEARLWIIGDGPERDALYRQIGDLDQRFRILLPGWFDCLDDLLQACDLAIVPAAHSNPPLAMLTALAASIPVVSAASPTDSEQSTRHDLVFPEGNVKALAAAITCALQSEANSTATTIPPHADEATAYLSLLESLAKTHH